MCQLVTPSGLGSREGVSERTGCQQGEQKGNLRAEGRQKELGEAGEERKLGEELEAEAFQKLYKKGSRIMNKKRTKG